MYDWPIVSEKTINRFWGKVQILRDDDCWEWQAGFYSGSHYGAFNFRGQNTNAHRAAWIFTHGEIENKDIFVLHKCDNRKCVNPNHLFLGTQQDNMVDMTQKHRHPTLFRSGESHPGAILTTEQVSKIRRMYIPYKVSQYLL